MIGDHATIPGHWAALNAAREGHRRCHEDIEALKHKGCEPPCEDISTCARCCGAILDRIHDRYRDTRRGAGATASDEWFSQRTAFLMTLDNMFAEAKEGKLELRAIGAAIESEKEAWYRLVLRRHPDFVMVSDRHVDQDAVRNILDDPDRSREELVSTVWEAVGKPTDWSTRVDAFAEKVAAAGGNKAKLRDLYASEFFKDSDGKVLDHAQPYLDMLLGSSGADSGGLSGDGGDGGMPMEEVVGRIIASKKESKALQAERDKARSEMEAVRRAKTAFEQSKADAKGRLRDAQARAVDERLYDLTACAACGGDAARAPYLISCALCQAFGQMGCNDQSLTVYCSEDCRQKAEPEHMEEKHCCSAGDECVRETDSDVEMTSSEDHGGSSAGPPAACSECLAQKRATLFCSRRCGRSNMARHRQEKHDAKTDPNEVEDLLSDLGEVVDELLRRENPGLEFTWTEG